MDQKDHEIIEIFTPFIKTRYFNGREVGKNLRRLVSKFYHYASTYPFTIFSKDALFNVFLDDRPREDETAVMIHLADFEEYLCYVFCSLRTNPCGFQKVCKEAYFFKEEETGDFSLRGFLSNDRNDCCFIPHELKEQEKEIFEKTFIHSDTLQFDSDLLFSFPIYIE